MYNYVFIHEIQICIHKTNTSWQQKSLYKFVIKVVKRLINKEFYKKSHALISKLISIVETYLSAKIPGELLQKSKRDGSYLYSLNSNQSN